MNRFIAIFCAVFFLAAPAFAVDDVESDFAGVLSCKKCHRKVFRSWKKSKMALSYEILKPGQRAEVKKKAGLDPQKDYTKDKTCLPCHTTGWGKEGGFTSVDKTPNMVGVSCEACHGPGKLYNVIMKKRSRVYEQEELVHVGFIPDPHRSCRLCHNENSPTRKFQDPFDAQLHDWPAHDPVKLKYHTKEYKETQQR